MDTEGGKPGSRVDIPSLYVLYLPLSLPPLWALLICFCLLLFGLALIFLLVSALHLRGINQPLGPRACFFTFILLDEGVSAFLHHLCRMLEEARSFHPPHSFWRGETRFKILKEPSLLAPYRQPQIVARSIKPVPERSPSILQEKKEKSHVGESFIFTH